MLKCKPIMRPNTGFLQQLSNWELHTLGTTTTDFVSITFLTKEEFLLVI